MKVTLIQPCVGRDFGQEEYVKTWQMEPLGPAVIAAVTPNDVEVAFYDDRLEQIPYEEHTDLVAITVETYTAKRSYQIASEYRKRGVTVVMGGFHPTLAPEEAIQYADSICIGEGEQVWPRMLKDFKAGKLKKFYKQEGRSEISTITPDRTIFEGKEYLDIGLVEAGRGCLFSCDFCAIQSFYKSTRSHRAIETIIDEIKSLDTDIFFLVDDNIIANRAWAKKFLKALAPLNITWVSQASINVTYDDELLGLLRDSGCFGLLIGFETLNEQNLTEMNKGWNQARSSYEDAINQMRKYGIRLYPTFIFGYPEDDEATFRSTVAFAKQQRFLVAAFNHILPFPGTPLYQRLKKEGRLEHEQWWLASDYRFGDVPITGNKLSSEEISQQCVKARKAFFSISSIIRRGLDRWNVRDAFSFRVFFTLNLIFRKETRQRLGMPMGDRSHPVELLPAEHRDETTAAEFLSGKEKLLSIQ